LREIAGVAKRRVVSAASPAPYRCLPLEWKLAIFLSISKKGRDCQVLAPVEGHVGLPGRVEIGRNEEPASAATQEGPDFRADVLKLLEQVGLVVRLAHV
jgi:hypothetical protein